MSAGHITRRGSRWSFVADLGRDPATGKRRQVRRSGYATRREAQHALTELLSAATKGTVPARRSLTFGEYASAWLESKRLKVRPVTARGYETNVRTACAHFGAVPLGEVQRSHVQAMVAAMVAAGRSQRTVSLLLFTVRSVFGEALADGLIGRDPSARVKATGRAPREREALSPDELARLRAHLSADPRAALWMLTLYGLRRSEVMGLRWSDVDLSTGLLSIERGVTDDHGRRAATATAPKTARGRRTLPLPADTVSALRALRDAQGAAFGLGHIRAGYLAVDEAGQPLRPERWSDLWTAHCREAGIRPVTLHAARHSSVTVMRSAGVPDDVVARWHGHDEVIMRRAYSHPDSDALASAGRVLGEVLGGNSVTNR